MLFSLKLLSRLVDIKDIPVDDLVNKLIYAGFEVEGVKKAASASKLVIGHVLSCKPHPDSDHLHVLKVDASQEGVLDIVCGAPNVKEGANVIVAMIGCELPAIGETIKAGVIRGFNSNGMCCSLSELGVDKSVQSEEDLKGIHLLPADAPIGERNVLGYLGLDDTILDVSILPNRPDCLCHLGFAKELSAIFQVKMVDLSVPEFKLSKEGFEVSSLTPFCDRFDLAVVELNKPVLGDDFKRMLMSLGVRSVSPIVDMGNFSMILTGQPLHIYDLDKVKGNKLTVRDDYEGKFVALDGKEYDIIKGDLVIEDAEKVCCLAGVMGGKSAEVDENTTRIGIECAHFYYANIRHTSSRLGLVSDSSALFSKGTNPYTVGQNMMISLDIGKTLLPSFGVKKYYSYNNVKPFEGKYPFSVDKLNAHLGMELSKEEVYSILDRLNLTYEEGFINLNVNRLDLLEQCDIEEEVFRLVPREKIKMSLDGLDQTSGGLTFKQDMVNKIKANLISHGLDQIVTYTLISKKMDSSFRVFDSNPSFKVNHPLTEDHEYVRSDLLASMVDVIKYNLNHKNDNIGLFEVSSIDTPKGNHVYLSIGLVGNKSVKGMMKVEKCDFFTVKGLIEDIMSLLGLDERRYSYVRSSNPSFHPGKSADILMGKKVIGTFGEVSPLLKMNDMVLAELDLSFLLEQKSSKLKVAPINLIPAIRRDLAFTLNDPSVTSDQIIKAIKKAGGKYVTKVEVFDVFTKDNVTSYAFAAWFVKEDKAFTDTEINSLLNTIIINVTHTLKVELRS